MNHDEIDALAVKIERRIAKNRDVMADLPEFAPRNNRAQRMKRKIERDA